MARDDKPATLPDGTTARFYNTGVLESATKQDGKPRTKLTATWVQDIGQFNENGQATGTVPQGMRPVSFSISAMLYQDGNKPDGTPRMRGVETGRKGASGAWPWTEWKGALRGAEWNNKPGEGHRAPKPMLVKLMLMPANEPYPARSVPMLFSPCNATPETERALADLMGDDSEADSTVDVEE